MKRGELLAVVLLSAIALLHLLRLVFRVEVIAGGATVPMWVSVVGLVVPSAIAFLLCREGGGARR